MEMPLLLVGPSVRAMAYSALRAGFTPLCFDLFADLDLQAVAQVTQIPLEDYPNKLPELLHRYDHQIPLMYTGGLENHPDLLQELSKQRPVWGYVPKGEGVRSPAFLDSLASEETFARLEHPTNPNVDVCWLLKPKAGSGGRGIREWKPGETVPENHFLELYWRGPFFSALFVATNEATQLLGVAETLDWPTRFHPPSYFSYVGSIGNIPLRPSQLARLKRIGAQLTEADPQLRGLFGIDFVLDGEHIILIEVNPRYTASTEVLELSLSISSITFHAMAFGGRRVTVPPYPPLHPRRTVGKAIYYAADDLRVPPLEWKVPQPMDVPTFADIPKPDSLIRRGDPVCTVMAQGKESETVDSDLNEIAWWCLEHSIYQYNRVDRLPDQP